MGAAWRTGTTFQPYPETEIGISAFQRRFIALQVNQCTCHRLAFRLQNTSIQSTHPYANEATETACRLVKLALENHMGEEIIVYFDEEFTAVYPLGHFKDWKYIPPLDRTALAELAARKVIELKFDYRIEMYTLTLPKAVFSALGPECIQVN